MSEYAVEVSRLNDDGTTDRVLFRQIIDGNVFDLSRIVAGINGLASAPVSLAGAWRDPTDNG